MARSRIAHIFAIAASLTASAAAFGAPDPARWHLRFKAISVDPSGDADEARSDGASVHFGFTSGVGVGGSAEYRLSDRLGLEGGLLSVSATNIVVQVTEPAPGDTFVDHDYTVFRPLYLGLNFHLTPGKRIDLYGGPVVSYVFFEDIHFQYGDGNRSVLVDDDFAFGATVGADLLLGKHRQWSMNAALQYFDTSVAGLEDGTEPFELSYDPLIFGFGFGYRF